MRGNWTVYLTGVITPNIPLGPNESSRVLDQLRKIIWDYRASKEGLARPSGQPNKQGHYHDFPFEPSVRVNPERDPAPQPRRAEATQPPPPREQEQKASDEKPEEEEDDRSEGRKKKGQDKDEDVIQIEQIHPLGDQPIAVSLSRCYSCVRGF